jgi:WD40 repeat protein
MKVGSTQMVRALVIGCGDFPERYVPDEEAAAGMGHFSPLPSVGPAVEAVAYALQKNGVKVTGPLLNPNQRELMAHWREARTEARDEPLIVHFSGHGHAPEKGSLYLAVQGSEYDRPETCVDFDTLLRDVRSGGPVLFLLDVCGGGRAVALQFGPRLVDGSLNKLSGRGLMTWVIAACPADSQTHEARFSHATAEVLKRLARNELDVPRDHEHVPVPTLAAAIQKELGRHGQWVVGTPHEEAVLDPPPFFRNPSYGSAVDTSFLARLEAHLWEFFPGIRHGFDLRHFATRAAGSSDANNLLFSGRSTQLRRIAAWLDDPEGVPERLLVITGGPGTGKSALLGVTVCAVHPKLKDLRGRVTSRLQDRFLPKRRPMLAVHARQLTVQQITDVLRRQLRSLGAGGADRGEAEFGSTASADTEELFEELRVAEPVIVVLDALDEAVDPAGVLDELLIPLSGTGQGDPVPGCRVMIGTRPWWSTFPDLGHIVRSRPDALVDLDQQDAKELAEDLKLYLELLLDKDDCYGPPTARAIADRFAAATAPFLMANLYADHLVREWKAGRRLMDQEIIDNLPGDIKAMFALHKATLVHDNPWIGPVLAVLGRGQGQGMPLELIHAAALAHAPDSGATGLRPRLEETREALNEAAFYLRTTPEDRPLYRYFHQELSDQMAEAADPEVILRAMLDTVSLTSEGTPDWAGAAPYVLRHAADHAADVSREAVDELIEDPSFLVHADPSTIGRALSSPGTDRARLAAAVYRASAHLHRNHDPATRRRLLAVDAARYGARDIVRSLTDGAPAGDWRPRWATGSRAHPALGHTFLGHTKQINDVLCHRFGGRLLTVTAGHDQKLLVWDMETGTGVGEPLAGHEGTVWALVPSEVDGTPVVVSAGNDATLRVWDPVTGAAVGRPWTGHDGSVWSLTSTTLKGQPVVVSGGNDGTLRVWDPTTGMAVGRPWTGHDGSVSSLTSTTLKGQPVVVSGGNDGTLRVWDPTTGMAVGQPWTGHSSHVSSLACSTVQGRPVLVSAGAEGTVRAWDLTSRQSLGTLQATANSMSVALACTSVDGNKVAVVSDDYHNLVIWDLAALEVVGTPLAGHTRAVTAVACATSGGRPVAVSGSKDHSVRVWNLAADLSSESMRRPGHAMRINAVDILQRGDRPFVVTAASDRKALLWDLATGEPGGELLTGHVHQINTVAVTTIAGRQAVITGSEDRTIRTSDAATGECLDVLGQSREVHTDPEGVKAIACGQLDGRPVAVAGSHNGVVRAWDLTDGGHPRTLYVPSLRNSSDQRVKAIACGHLDGRPVAVAGSHNGVVRAWDLTDGRPLLDPLILKGRTVAAITLVALDDGLVAAVGSYDGTVTRWHLGTGAHCEFRPLPLGKREELGVASDRLRAQAAATVRGTPSVLTGGLCGLHILDMRNGLSRPVGQVRWDHRRKIRAVAYARMGGRDMAVTGHENGSIRLWDLGARVWYGELSAGSDKPVYVVACTEEDGHPIAVTVSGRTRLCVWDLASQELLRTVVLDEEKPIRAMALTRIEGRPVAVTDAEGGAVSVWELDTGRPQEERRPSAGTATLVCTPDTTARAAVPEVSVDRITAMACARVDDRSIVLSGGREGQIALWDLEERRPGTPREVGTIGRRITHVALCEVDGAWVAAACGSHGRVHLWDLDPVRPRCELGVERGLLMALACTVIEGRGIMVTGGSDGVVRIWDIASGRETHALAEHRGSIRTVACGSLDGRPAAVTGGADHGVRVWALDTFTCEAVIPMPALVSALVFAPAGALVVCADRDVVVLDRLGEPGARGTAEAGAKELAVPDNGSASEGWSSATEELARWLANSRA